MIYILLLFAVVLSYGQILGMGVWQDDNGLFFKLAHIGENAGYLGAGPFGVGPYKYIQTGFIPIYNLFGFDTRFYFLTAIVFYLIATLVVYYVYKQILGKNGGKVAGFIYAAGYIASDGFIRLFNTLVTSVSVVTISFLTLSYWKYLNKKHFGWYFAALLFYFLSIELARGRTHYLIAVVIVAELAYLNFRKQLVKNIFNILFRLIPFFYVFYIYFVKNADHRSANVSKFVKSLLAGDYYQLYGFLSSTANTFIPDWLTSWLTNISSARIIWIILISIISLLFAYLYKKSKAKKYLFLYLLCLIWAFISRSIFKVPQLTISSNQSIVAFLGGVCILVGIAGVFLVNSKYKKLYIILFTWVLVNIAAYSAYNPLVVYETINRYLAHSFFALVGLYAVIFVSAKNSVVKLLVFLFVIGNIFASVMYQNKVVRERSIPANNFYQQLKSHVGSFEKGSVFYFDVADDSRGYFADAFSVASMPETTAIAWRYGVDRYDLYRVTEYSELISLIKDKNISPNKIYSFFYSNKVLINTTEELRKSFTENELPIPVKLSVKESEGDLIITPESSVKSVAPIELSFEIISTPLKATEIIYPFIRNKSLSTNSVAISENLREKSFEYRKFKEDFRNNTEVTSSNDWRLNVAKNAIDGNSDTLWQADRVKWGKGEETILSVDLKDIMNIDRLLFLNGYANNSPTNYVIESSIDNINWELLKEVDVVRKIEPIDLQVITFSKKPMKHIRMRFLKTLNSDSPAISEIWVTNADYSEVDINSAEKFLNDPFGYLSDSRSYLTTLSKLGYSGNVVVSWMNNKHTSWVSSPLSRMRLNYDSIQRRYKLVLPAGGTNINSIKFSPEIPGTIKINNLSIRYTAVNGK